MGEADVAFTVLQMPASSKSSSTAKSIFSRLSGPLEDTDLNWLKISWVSLLYPINKSDYGFLQTEYKYCYDVVLHYVLHYLQKDLEEIKIKSKN